MNIADWSMGNTVNEMSIVHYDRVEEKKLLFQQTLIF